MSFTPGSFSYDAAYGLVLAGQTGSVFDFAIVDALGAPVVGVPTGTSALRFLTLANGYLRLDGLGNLAVAPSPMFIDNLSGNGLFFRTGTINDSTLAIGNSVGIEWYIRADKSGAGVYQPLSVYVGGGLAYSISTAQQITFTNQAVAPAFSSTAATDSSGPSTGAILTLGGLGVLKKAFFGDNVTTSQRFRSAPVGSAIVVSMWQDGALAKIGTETAHDLLLVRNGLIMAQLTATGLESFGTIKTVAPSGGTSQPWKLGEIIVAPKNNADRLLRVEVNGTLLYVMASTTP
jgi:hypothetical protein